MKKLRLIGLLIFAAVFLSGCSFLDVIRFLTITTVEKVTDGLQGTWYEQEPFGGCLEIGSNTIRYTFELYSGDSFTDETAYSLKEDGSRILIETQEEWFSFVDMYYDRKQDLVVGYTLPVMDGDGGYHYTEFKRTRYTAPPEPVYGPAVDLSDPDARKDFDDLTIRHMKASFYDEGPYFDPSSNLAMEPPYPDHYSYDLTVLEDGSALVSSSFCQEIELPKETVDELQELARQADLGKINGINIHTPDLPDDAPDYEVELELASSDVIRSSANGSDVPENWAQFQEGMHHLLFFAFMDAGYQLNGEFHSTKPMKRVGYPEEERAPLGLSYSSVQIYPEWEQSYDYSQHAGYFVFSDENNEYPVVMKTLDELAQHYETLAREDLQKDHEALESVPESVWKKEERRYGYSFYSVEYCRNFGPFFSFLLSEGHANSLGVGEYGYGYYPNYYFNIDISNGKIIPVSDLFLDEETAFNVICESVRSEFGTYSERGKYIHSEEFSDALRTYISLPAPEGIGWYAYYDRIILYFPKELFPMTEDTMMHSLYYDSMQDELGETYTSVW